MRRPRTSTRCHVKWCAAHPSRSLCASLTMERHRRSVRFSAWAGRPNSRPGRVARTLAPLSFRVSQRKRRLVCLLARKLPRFNKHARPLACCKSIRHLFEHCVPLHSSQRAHTHAHTGGLNKELLATVPSVRQANQSLFGRTANGCTPILSHETAPRLPPSFHALGHACFGGRSMAPRTSRLLKSAHGGNY